MTNQNFEAVEANFSAPNNSASLRFADERHTDMMCHAWQPCRTSAPDMVDALRSTPDGGTQTLFQILNQHDGETANSTLTRHELGDYLQNYEQNCLDGKPGYDPANRKVVSDLYRNWDYYSEQLGVEPGKGCFGGLAEGLDRATITVKELDNFDDRPRRHQPIPWPREDRPWDELPRFDLPKFELPRYTLPVQLEQADTSMLKSGQ